MIDERKIVTHKQAKEFASDSFGSYYGDFEAIWNQLPDAPKYTDAEVDEILARSLRKEGIIQDYASRNRALETRIKELEEELYEWRMKA